MRCTRFRPRLIIAVAGLGLLTAVSCKKNKEQAEELPILGTCAPVTPKAGLTTGGEGIYEYNSAGGVVVKIHRKPDVLTITMTDKSYPNVTYQLWGSPTGGDMLAAAHESLNGKHLKDRIGTSRTIFWPDGTKITCVSTGPAKAVTAISIYDGSHVQHINIACDKLEYSASNAFVAKKLDDMQSDGETSTYERTPTGLIFYNSYTENIPGNKVNERVNLGELFIARPTQVNDLYDDPRLFHT